jgi:hypothetical protein
MLSALSRIAVMLALAAGLGAASSQYHDLPWKPDAEKIRRRLREQERKKQEFQELRQTIGITLADLREYIARGAVIIDARDRGSFEREHLDVSYPAPVLNLPPEDTLDKHLDRLMQLQGYPLVLYCNSATCDLAEELYVDLRDAGLIPLFPEVRIYFPGWASLEKTDLPKTSGADTWSGFAGAVAAEPNRPADPNAGSGDESTHEPNGGP